MHRPISRLFLDQSTWNFGSVAKIKFSNDLISYFSSLRRRVDQFMTPRGAGVEDVWSLILILGMEPKNQVIWTTRCKVMAKYDIFRYISEKAGWPQGTSKTKIVSWTICIGLLVAFVLPGTPRKKTPEWSLSLKGMYIHFILSGPCTSLHIFDHIHC